MKAVFNFQFEPLYQWLYNINNWNVRVKESPMSENVYPIVYLPKHKRADITGMVKKHILVMCEHLGRIIDPKKEIIHHVDFNKAHNNVENLLLMTREQHQNLPLRQFQFIQSIGLVDEWIKWYEVHKNDVDQKAALEMLIVHQERKQERVKARIARRTAYFEEQDQKKNKTTKGDSNDNNMGK